MKTNKKKKDKKRINIYKEIKKALKEAIEITKQIYNSNNQNSIK